MNGGSDVVVTARVGLIIIDMALETKREAESLALRVNENVPGVEGVPEITPVALSRYRPSGRAPEVICHVYGNAIPPAVTV
jgi:hypothetical protein